MGSIRSHVHRLDGVVIQGRIILQGFSVVARGSVSCGIKLRCLRGVVLEDLGAGTGRLVSCVGRRRRCGLVSALPRKHRYTSGRPTNQRTIDTIGARRHRCLNSK